MDVIETTGEGGAPDSNCHEEFYVHQHETWYNLSAYLSSSVGDLAQVADRVLQLGFASFVSLPDGKCGWLLDGQVVFDSLGEVDTMLSHQTQFTLPVNLDPSLKSEVAWTAALRSAERKLFNSNSVPEAYLRMFCHPVKLILDHGVELLFRVQVKLYVNGLIMVSFILSESHSQDLETFIATRVNLGQMPIRAVELDAQFAYLCLDAQSGEDIGFLGRRKVLRLRRLFRSHYPAQVRGDGAEYVRMSGGDKTFLAGIALDLVRSLAYCLGRPRKGLPFLLFGDNSAFYWTGFWSASPHIHLLGFSDQSTSAQVNESRHAPQLLRILTRTPPSDGQLVALELPRDLRVFDDLGMYINEATLLWVHSGLMEEVVMNGSRERPLWLPTIEHQVKGEVIEAAPMMYRMFIHELENRKLTWDGVLSIWERASNFELSLNNIGRYGEVREALSTAWDVRGLPELREIFQGSVGLRERSSSVAESRLLSAVGAMLTVIVGLVGLPPFAQFVADHLFPLWGWEELADPTLTVTSVGLSLLVISGALFGAYRVLRRKRWIQWNSSSRRE